jgi:hypothetical protein
MRYIRLARLVAIGALNKRHSFCFVIVPGKYNEALTGKP